MDSGPMIALFDSSDKYYSIAKDFVEGNTSELLTSIASVTETMYMLDFNKNAQIDFLEWLIRGAVQIIDIGIDELDRIKVLLKKYQDLPMDFADACLVCIGEKFNINEVATIDRDFSIYRLHGRIPFQMKLK
jgi:predicted nucleic acid-binding protein